MSMNRVVSADSHFLEPETLWVERLDKKYRDRGPRTAIQDGVEMLFGEDMEPQPVSVWCAAGQANEDLLKINKLGFKAAPEGVRDPAGRLKAQDRDNVLAEVLYSSFGMVAMNIRDPELANASLRVFNDYASEFCSYDPKRLVGIGAVIPDDVPTAVGEIERIAKLGLHGVMIPITLAEGESYGDPKYDPIWAAAQANKLILSFHAGTSRAGINPKPGEWAQLYMGAPVLMQKTLTDIIVGGVFDRFPDLFFVSVENDVAWLPHYAYRLDHFVDRFYTMENLNLKRTPTEYIQNHFFSTFTFEGEGVETVRRLLGSEVLMWGNDFPHLDSTWPKSPQALQDTLLKVSPDADAQNMLYNNVVKLYDLDFPLEATQAQPDMSAVPAE
jgi:predicted TIM-barrel fold metal-dependent hydrolase